MRRFRLTRTAEADLEEIASYIAADNPQRARSFVAALRDSCARLADQPRIGRERPELGSLVRSIVVFRHYVLFYRLDTDGDAVIIRVLHGARDIAGMRDDIPDMPD